MVVESPDPDTLIVPLRGRAFHPPQMRCPHTGIPQEKNARVNLLTGVPRAIASPPPFGQGIPERGGSYGFLTAGRERVPGVQAAKRTFSSSGGAAFSVSGSGHPAQVRRAPASSSSFIQARKTAVTKAPKKMSAAIEMSTVMPSRMTPSMVFTSPLVSMY